jgi:hypothetical protein
VDRIGMLTIFLESANRGEYELCKNAGAVNSQSWCDLVCYRRQPEDCEYDTFDEHSAGRLVESFHSILGDWNTLHADRYPRHSSQIQLVSKF